MFARLIAPDISPHGKGNEQPLIHVRFAGQKAIVKIIQHPQKSFMSLKQVTHA
jgi:hypothetical protein